MEFHIRVLLLNFYYVLPALHVPKSICMCLLFTVYYVNFNVYYVLLLPTAFFILSNSRLILRIPKTMSANFVECQYALAQV